jgi:hypothetical protein
MLLLKLALSYTPDLDAGDEQAKKHGEKVHGPSVSTARRTRSPRRHLEAEPREQLVYGP